MSTIRSVTLHAFSRQGSPTRARRRRTGTVVPPASRPPNSPPLAFVNFLQNQDQIGKRPPGDRLGAHADDAAIAAALTVTLLTPMPPLMFMGEEWGSIRPFPFFCDFRGELAQAVRQGRR